MKTQLVLDQSELRAAVAAWLKDKAVPPPKPEDVTFTVIEETRPHVPRDPGQGDPA